MDIKPYFVRQGIASFLKLKPAVIFCLVPQCQIWRLCIFRKKNRNHAQRIIRTPRARTYVWTWEARYYEFVPPRKSSTICSRLPKASYRTTMSRLVMYSTTMHRLITDTAHINVQKTMITLEMGGGVFKHDSAPTLAARMSERRMLGTRVAWYLCVWCTFNFAGNHGYVWHLLEKPGYSENEREAAPIFDPGIGINGSHLEGEDRRTDDDFQRFFWQKRIHLMLVWHMWAEWQKKASQTTDQRRQLWW